MQTWPHSRMDLKKRGKMRRVRRFDTPPYRYRTAIGCHSPLRSNFNRAQHFSRNHRLLSPKRSFFHRVNDAFTSSSAARSSLSYSHRLSQLCQAFSENKGANMMLLVRFCYLCMSNTNKEGLAYVYATI